ncbi:MAG: isocitrate dehydrogenase kinase/phosphatase AceK regulatory subunit [Desulforhopalus sp.]
MTEKPDQVLESIHQQFLEYYDGFLKIAERAPELFVAGKLDERLQDDLVRVQLYRVATDKSVTFASNTFKEAVYDRGRWEQLRQRFKTTYKDKLATTYFTSVMRKIFAQKELSIEFGDDGIEHRQVAPDKIVNCYPLQKRSQLGKTIQMALNDSVFSDSLSDNISQDTDVIIDIISEQLAKEGVLTTFEVLKQPFFRGKGAYLVGQLRTNVEVVPVIISCIHSAEGVKVDAVLVGYQATRVFLFSSTRSAFTVSTRHYQELYSFLQRLFPGENPAYILDIIGFSHPAKISLLQQLRKIFQSGEQCRYLGIGPVDLVFGVKGFPLVFKVLRRDLPDKQSVVNNFIKVHTIDRLGQILDSLDYRNLQFDRNQFSEALIGKLETEQPEDVTVTSDHVFFKRVYAARRIIPVIEQVRTTSKKEARQLLLKVGWNIKHLAAMGFLPKSLGLGHFGLTSWGRVVYLDNASLIDIRLFHFCGQPDSALGMEQYTVDPAAFEQELNIPRQHRDIFRAIHGDLFSAHFWEDIRVKVYHGRYPDFFPYPSRFRLESRKFRCSVFEELQRMNDTADAKQIHMALDNLAVVDVELAGLSFLRLEVPHPSARVLVIEPIGPVIIAQLHRRFKDVTFDVLQAESEVVESAGQWSPGIHGRLNALVQVRKYDYVIGYINETFDEDFFCLAKLKGFLLLSTGTHNIDVQAATSFHTVVTNAPGPTTTTVAEQNIGLILDAIYSKAVRYGQRPDGFIKAAGDVTILAHPSAIAQAMWLCFLQKTLKLDAMFSFGASELYVRTGVGERATVYHDQIGQNVEAGIRRSIGVIGLHGAGLHIIEFSIVHEVSTIYVLDDEYRDLPPETKERLEEMLSVKKETSKVHDLSIQLVPVSRAELFLRANYCFTTEISTFKCGINAQLSDKIHIDIEEIFVCGLLDLYTSPTCKLTLGIQGLGRIGEAVAQRAISLGMSILIYQRDPDRPKYQKKLANLKELAAHHNKWVGQSVTVLYAEDKAAFFKQSNIITTLAATTDKTRGWVDPKGLEQFACQASSPVRVIVSAGKGLVDEDALLQFLKRNRDAEARLDVLAGEHEGRAYLRLVDDDGHPLTNIKVTGHTAAAVREVRQLKIFKALDNLRRLIDGRIPPNIVNNPITQGKSAATQSIVKIEDLRFFRMSVSSPRARVLVIEPLPPELVLQLQLQFGDVSFDILLAESELIEVDGAWAPGINSRLNAIVASQEYDYCLGYCNANFDASFFKQARLQGLILFATATHHIDLETATQMRTTVTNSPGYTTVAVTEQNIGMALDALYGGYVQDHYSEGVIALNHIDVENEGRARAVAQIMWFILLRRALRLDAMYEFGSGDKYVRTGVRRDATVYHDQLGQHSQAGIHNSIGIIGLDEVGLSLVELAMAYEVSTILILDEEYSRLSERQRTRLDDLSKLLPEVSQTKSFTIQIQPVGKDELIHKATYTIKTPVAYKNDSLREIKTRSSISVHADKVYINDLNIFDRSLIGLTFGVQGLGRIGEAVVQRALALGANVVVCQRNPKRPRYQQKQKRLRRLAQNRARIYCKKIDVEYVDKAELFTTSNIVTTLAATTSSTRYWVDREALDMLGNEAQGSVRVLVNAGKGLLNEADLAPFLRERHDVEVRLDVLTDEQKGKAGQRFMDSEGRPLGNLKIAGHTAAAVPELRRLKIINAFKNLRLHIDGHRPNNILNPKIITER